MVRGILVAGCPSLEESRYNAPPGRTDGPGTIRRVEPTSGILANGSDAPEGRPGYSLPFSFVRIPIPAPCRLHPLLEIWRVHFRKALQGASPFTIAHQGGELLHVGEGLANGVKATVEARTFDFRFCRPLEAALVIVAFEFELSDEHQILIASKSCGPTEASLVRPTQPRVNKRTLQITAVR